MAEEEERRANRVVHIHQGTAFGVFQGRRTDHTGSLGSTTHSSISEQSQRSEDPCQWLQGRAKNALLFLSCVRGSERHSNTSDRSPSAETGGLLC